jgi:hypothetical protein
VAVLFIITKSKFPGGGGGGGTGGTGGRGGGGGGATFAIYGFANGLGANFTQLNLRVGIAGVGGSGGSGGAGGIGGTGGTGYPIFYNLTRIAEQLLLL